MTKLVDEALEKVRNEQSMAPPPNKFRSLINLPTIFASSWYFGFWKTMGGLWVMNRLANEEDRYTTERDLYRPQRDKSVQETISEVDGQLALARIRARKRLEKIRARQEEADKEAEQIRSERAALSGLMGKKKVSMCPYCGKRHGGECPH